LKVLQSSVIRSDPEQKILENFGQRAKVFRLTGYLFFGSIYNLENKLSKLDINDYDFIIIDFSKVSGMDSSASQVFQRILTRYSQHQTQWFFVYTLNLQNKLLSIQKNQKIETQMLLFKSFDLALEASEDLIIQKHQINQLSQTCFSFFSNAEQIEQFKAYCLLKTIPSDDFLVREGDRTNDLFFLKSGEFEVIKDINHQEIRLAKLKAGAMVGELAFYNHGERSASIRANCISEVYVLTEDSFKAMRNHTSDLASQLDFYVIRKISQSLLKTNKLIDSIV
jgi:SulP family sulfate permease